MKRHNLIVKPNQDGMRLDLFMMEGGIDLSRRKIRSIIDVGGVYVNNKRVRIASRQVNIGDKVRIEYNLDNLVKVKQQAFAFEPKDVLYDDGFVIGINKPPGLPSQATRDQSVMHVEPCLKELYKKNGKKPPGQIILIHRLDKETSGVLVLVTNKVRSEWMTDQFRDRQVKKVYWAVCYGIPKEKEFEVNNRLSDIEKNTGIVRAVQKGGRSALTKFRVLKSNRELQISLIECEPYTGRSHQIRVHLEGVGFPIIGDKKYGNGNRHPLPETLTALTMEHHFLHAKKLTFAPGPEEKAVTIEAPLPPLFEKFLVDSALAP